ncbi:Uncharacterised protein [uncultured archaeon]|nr:Uncharacterised protein [uncultured archaeon]
MPRFWELDALRGTAIVMMAVFHFAWDMNYFGAIHADLYAGPWGLFQKATAGLFLLVAGVLLAVNSQNHAKEYPRRFLERGAMVFLVGLGITAATFPLFPENFIYFGILHLIGVSIILAIPLARKKWLNLLLSAIVIALPMATNLQNLRLDYLVWAGFAYPKATFDFAPVFPWFGLVLIGLFFGNLLYEKGERIFSLEEPRNRASYFLQILGRNSLVLYLAHQGILFPLAWLVSIAH